MEQEKWTLDRIEISRQQWGEDKGKYKGEIKFSNGKDEFKFALNETLAKVYLSLIKDTVISGANELGNKLIESLEEKNENQNQE